MSRERGKALDIIIKEKWNDGRLASEKSIYSHFYEKNQLYSKAVKEQKL